MARRARLGDDEDDDVPVGKSNSRVSYATSVVRQGTHRFFTLTMPSDVLVASCSVDMRSEDPIKGFQRRLDHRRAKDIADYIDGGLGTIPGSIVLSAQREGALTHDTTNATISFRRHPRAFLILDGQHRVYGFHLAKTKRLRVPVVIYNGLPKDEEVRLFIDINTKQRPVPNELLLDIKKLAEIESTEEANLRDLFDLFDRQPRSPLAGLMSASERKPNRISRVTFNAALRAIYHNISDSDVRRTYNVLSSYLRAWVACLEPKGLMDILINPTAFRAIMLLFPHVAQRVADRYAKEYTTDNFNEVLSPVLLRFKRSDLDRQGYSHLDLAESMRRKLDSSFSLGVGRL